MGAPKQKWTKEEESALRQGIEKYGPGKWSAILKDPIFSVILACRSNVDLKDKWRNINVTAQGWGSRERARMAFKKSSQIARQMRHDDDSMALVPYARPTNMMMVSDPKPISMVEPPPQLTYPQPTTPQSSSRFEKLVIEAIATLNEHRGSNKTAITTYIEENHLVPYNFKKLLSPTLKSLISKGRLIKIGPNYRIHEHNPSYDGAFRHSYQRVQDFEGRKLLSPDAWKRLEEEIKIPTKAEIDEEISAIAMMNAEDAARAAAEAVYAAEIAIAEAEAAVKEAEAAEAEFEAAQAFAEATKMNLRNARSY